MAVTQNEVNTLPFCFSRNCRRVVKEGCTQSNKCENTNAKKIMLMMIFLLLFTAAILLFMYKTFLQKMNASFKSYKRVVVYSDYHRSQESLFFGAL